jgi:hypothetical protein
MISMRRLPTFTGSSSNVSQRIRTCASASRRRRRWPVGSRRPRVRVRSFTCRRALPWVRSRRGKRSSRAGSERRETHRRGRTAPLPRLQILREPVVSALIFRR